MTRRPAILQVLGVSALLAVAVLALAVQSLGADEPGAWDATPADVPGPRQEVSYVRVGTTLYLAGGETTQRSYDTVSNTWNDPATEPLESFGNLDHIQGVAIGGRIYYLGGLDRDIGFPSGEVGTVKIFDPATAEMTDGAPMPAGRARGAGATAVFDGLIYYFGGLNGGTAKPWVDVYDPVEDGWRSLPDMPDPRDHAVAVPLGGLIHLIGGRAGTDFDTTTGAHSTFNPATGAWVTGLPALGTARGGHAAAVLGGEIVVFGGEGPPVEPDPSPAIARVEAYSPQTNSWRDLTPMAAPRHGIQAAVCSGSAYLAAGADTAFYAPTDTHDRFSLGTAQPCTNSAPACAASDLATPRDTPVTADLNCADADGDALAYSVAGPPRHGTLSGPDAGGGFTYTPAPGFRGRDSFSARATDGTASPPATISIQVGDDPNPPLPGRCANGRTGTRAPDRIIGTTFGDAIFGLAGDDTLRGLAGADCLSGGRGGDKLFGGAGADELSGGRGGDLLSGGSGPDAISAGTGGNTLRGGAGADSIDSANGRRDVVNCGPGRDRVRADRRDRLAGCERVPAR